MLKLRIRQNNIEIEQEAEYNRGTVGAKVNIIFDNFWTDFEKTVVFKRCYDALSEPINVIVNDMDTTIDIPPEILAESGKFRIGVFGIKDNVVWPTLYSKEFDSRYATDTKGKSPDTYTPSEIDQLRILKQNKLTAGDGIEIDENNVISAIGGGGDGTTDYNALKNKPKINGVELEGDKSLEDLGIEIPNLDEYYTKTEVDDLIGDIEALLGGI